MKRRQFWTNFFIGLVACFLVASCAGLPSNSDQRQGQPVSITVSAAASLQDVLDAIDPQFREAYPDITTSYNFGSSGALQQQIEQGAPTDVFFSAAIKQMDALVEQDLIVPDSRQNVVTNSLVLIASKDSNLEITDLTQLKDANIQHFAVGEFRSVPAGQYAEQVLTHMGLLDTLQPKFVFGNNVRSVLGAVETGNAELGMVYATDAALSDRIKVVATAPEESHQPIVYPIAVVKTSTHPEAAQTLIDFLMTEDAQKTFEEFGFGTL